jgi:hypothetical protein
MVSQFIMAFYLTLNSQYQQHHQGFSVSFKKQHIKGHLADCYFYISRDKFDNSISIILQYTVMLYALYSIPFFNTGSRLLNYTSIYQYTNKPMLYNLCFTIYY